MSRFYDIKVAAVKPETEFAKVVEFEIPIELKDLFKYVPGQYLTLEVEVGGEKYRRAYSICTSYLANESLAIGIKKVEGGIMSNYMNNLQAGTTLHIMPPMGNFIHHPNSSLAGNYVFFGGGSGITPLMSLIKSILLGEPNSRTTLYYCNRNENSIMFRGELDNLQQRFGNRLNIIHNLDEPPFGWAGGSGMFSSSKAVDFINKYVSGTADYFICGPSGMMAEVDAALAQLGVGKNHIFKEFFAAPLQTPESKPAVAVSSHGVVSDKPLKEADLVITIDRQQYEIKFENEDSLLEAALDKGLDPPYACQIGACCTCRAKVLEGEVMMVERESLSDSEIAEGYILTCQAKPLTSKVVYTYDE
jgi:ring-1,2-phenylacetyl-CoA epoxidase subunit PaaE